MRTATTAVPVEIRGLAEAPGGGSGGIHVFR